MMDHTSFPQAKIVCMEVKFLVWKHHVSIIFIFMIIIYFILAVFIYSMKIKRVTTDYLRRGFMV
jgi:hypothetical protein